MTDKIAEIRKRYAFAEENKSAIRPAGFSWTIPGWQAHNDRSYLLAEVDRLTRERDEARAEVERLTGKLKLVADALNETVSKCDEVGDQNDRLDAENERLREALHRVSLASQNSMSSKDECGRIAREALEAKP